MIGLHLLLLFASPVLPAELGTFAATFGQETKSEKSVYDEKADAGKQISAALAKAKRNNSRVLIQWGANWCGWCVKLDHTMQTDGKLRRKILYEYEVVKVDVGRFDKNMDLVKKFGADLRSSGIPFLTVLDQNGKVVQNQETAGFEVEAEGKSGHDPKKVMAFLEKHQAPYLKAESLLAAGLKRAEKESKKLFLSFGAPWCGWCHKLEDTLARAGIAPLMAKDFVVLKIDIDRTLGGKEIMNRYRRQKSGGIPWFVFLNPKGEALLTSDGPKGNLGCPYTEEEVHAFGQVLEKMAVALTAEEQRTILNAFHSNRRPKVKS
ncbi:MAG: thioredoxin family protein [Planctomycetota bacterium]|nr:MAG: thioredoxin family protein [Planctomycetota bacterium]